MRLLNHTYLKSAAFDTPCYPESFSSLIIPLQQLSSKPYISGMYCIIKKKEKLPVTFNGPTTMATDGERGGSSRHILFGSQSLQDKSDGNHEI